MLGERPVFWVLFNLFVCVMLALDLGVFHRKAHAIKTREAIGWSVFWVSLAMIFNGIVYYWLGKGPAVDFLTGYLIEKSLSVDNIFIFLIIFSYFRVPAIYQHRILYWGIIGALIMRGILIIIGAALIKQFHWVIYIFGGFLLFTAYKMMFSGEKEPEPENNPVIRFIKRHIPITSEYEGYHFFKIINGKRFATPIFLVLCVIETTDLVFALDSIPAIFAITGDPFIIYTSNVFAILGLRSLFFLLAGIMDKFFYLKKGLAVILGFVGSKMMASEHFPIPTSTSLLVVFGILTVAVVASLVRAKRIEKQEGQ